MVMDDPISFILRRVLLDPATNKLLTFVFSLVLVISCADNVRYDYNKIPLIVIFGSSLLYSAFALLVAVFKKQENITNCAVLKKVFRGRAVFWHEIQTSAAFTFAIASIFGIVSNETSYESAIQVIFSSLNIFFYTLEWYFASEKSKPFVTEENPKLGHNCLDCILGGIHAFPLFFNIIRKGCLIAALVLVVANSNFGYSISYFIYCIAFAIAGSFMLFVLQTSGSLENAISTKLISGRKWHTYLMLAVMIHCFLAVLTFSLIVEYREGYRSRLTNKPVYDYYSNYYNNYTGYYNNNNDYYRRRGYYNNRDSYSNGYLASRTPPPLYYATPSPSYLQPWRNRQKYGESYQTTDRPTTVYPTTYFYKTTWYTDSWWENKLIYAVIESPIAFGLCCVALLFSILDLYARAIYSRSRRDNETTAPLYTASGITKVEDLPISFASPHSFDNPNKPQLYI